MFLEETTRFRGITSSEAERRSNYIYGKLLKTLPLQTNDPSFLLQTAAQGCSLTGPISSEGQLKSLKWQSNSLNGASNFRILLYATRLTDDLVNWA